MIKKKKNKKLKNKKEKNKKEKNKKEKEELIRYENEYRRMKIRKKLEE